MNNAKPEIFGGSKAILLLLLWLLLAATAFSSSASSASTGCSASFPTALSNSQTTGSISIDNANTIIGTPSNLLQTQNLTVLSQPACDGNDCVASGTTSAPLSYSGFPGGANVTPVYGQTTNLTPGDYGSLSGDGSVTINFTPGDYTFNGDVQFSYASVINIVGTGTVRLYVNGKFTVRDTVQLATSSAADQVLFVYSTGNMKLWYSSTSKFLGYSEGSITLDSSITVEGALAAQGSIVTSYADTITYNATMVSTVSGGSSCAGSTSSSSSSSSSSASSSSSSSSSSTSSGAANCSAIFPSTASNSSLTGSVHIGNQSNLLNSPNDIIVTKQLSEISPPSCGLENCIESGTTSTSFNFTDFPGGPDIMVNYATTHNFVPGDYGSLTTGSITTLNFEPGVYTFDGDVEIEWGTIISASMDGTVEIYINGNLGIRGNIQLNMSGNPNRHFFIFTTGNMMLWYDSDSTFAGYAKGTITLDDAVTVTGALTSESAITLDYQASVTYDTTTLDGVSSAGVCGSIPATPALNHFDWTVSGSGSTCSALEVTLTARDVYSNVLSDYEGTIALSTSTNHGDWAKTATVSDAYGLLSSLGSDVGSANYTFDPSDAGSITLALNNIHAENLQLTAFDSSASVTTSSSAIAFGDNAFVFDYVDTLGADVIAGRPHLLQVDMMQRDPVTGDCQVASNYSVADVKMYLTRQPSDPGGAAPVVSNATNTDSVSLPNTTPGTPNLTLSFASGSAQLFLQTSDVGEYALNIVDDSTAFSGLTIIGSSSVLTARPFGFGISVTGNPGATDAAGPTFIAAGEPFDVQVTAVAWQSADDANNDGIPDGHDNVDATDNINLSNNNALVSFGQESPPMSVSLTSELILPSGGHNPLLSIVSAPTAFSNGVATATVAFNDVGIMAIKAAVAGGAYLSSNSVYTERSESRTSTIGRFTPNVFTIDASTITPFCSVDYAHSYLGQPLEAAIRLTARALGGVLCENYEGAFARYSDALFIADFTAIDTAGPTALSSRVEATTVAFAWGNGVLDATYRFGLNRAASPDGPFLQTKIGFVPMDEDGVTLASSELNLDSDSNGSLDSAEIDEQRFRYGRLRLSDSHGPETADLPVQFVTEYWDGTRWVVNGADSCTTVALANIGYPSGSIDTPANRNVTVGASTTVGAYANLGGSVITFSEGDAGHYFTAPGENNTGQFDVDVDITQYPWLAFDWNGDGNYNDTALPTATFHFGNYRGHDRVLYWHEVLQ